MESTIKLYDRDPYGVEFEATVLQCQKTEAGCRLILDQTLFFPEEGGQSPDQGTIDGVEVLDVQLEDDVIVHLLPEELPAGKNVKGKIDWQHRFSNMQQHTGEHIFSGIVHSRFGLDNVGFHLSDSIVTMDYNGVLTEEQIRQTEWEANQVIARNLPVEVTYPTREEAQNMDFRSKKEIRGQIRIVTVPGVDVCACCAPHVRRTGEIGMLKVMHVQNYKGGVRLSILCGFRALEAFRKKDRTVSDMMHVLSSGEDTLTEYIRRLQDQVKQLKEQLSAAGRRLLEQKKEQIPAEQRHVLLFENGLEEPLMRETVNELTKLHSGFSGVLSMQEDGSYRFVIGSPELDCRKLAELLRKELGARGGGSPQMIQGSLQASEEDIEKLVSGF